MDQVAEASYDYGYWSFAIFNVVLFAFFALSYFKPKTKWDWRTFGGFMAFIIALFTEMYGFPLSIYLISGWLLTKFPQLDLFAHRTGRLWQTVFDLNSDLSWYIFVIGSNILIWGGVIFLGWSWRHLLAAQKVKRIAKTGPYKYVRHPQYIAFVIVMIGFLIQWPTIPTLIMFPILLVIYWQLAKREERDSIKTFGQAYEDYRQEVPAFIPKMAWASS